MRVAVGLSGGVDSTVAAKLLLQEGHEVTGVYMRLWGGARQGSSCSTADAKAAREAADHLGIKLQEVDHTKAFETNVIMPFVEAAKEGRTLNPCLSCNKTFKVEMFLDWARTNDYDKIATGHHAQVKDVAGRLHLGRSVDKSKDQSYVLSMLTPSQLQRIMLPLGKMTKETVRRLAAKEGAPSSDTPDSMDLCFSGPEILTQHGVSTTAKIVDEDGTEVGSIEQAESVTIGQRKGLGLGGGGERRYVVSLDLKPYQPRVVVGTLEDLLTESTKLEGLTWTYEETAHDLDVQTSAHGHTGRGTMQGDTLHWDTPQRRVAPGQTVVLYQDDHVVGSALAT